MDNTDIVTEQKVSKSHWALPIFILDIILGAFTFLAYAFRHGPDGGSRNSHVYLISLSLITLLTIFSINLYIQSNRGLGKKYGALDLIITLIVPILILLLAFRG